MASAWGKSWGAAFGAAFGVVSFPSQPLPPVSGVYGGSFRAPDSVVTWAQEQNALTKLHQDDQLVSELLVSIVLKGFFDGTHQHSSP